MAVLWSPALLCAIVWSANCAILPSVVPKFTLNDGNEMPGIALGTWLGYNDQNQRVVPQGSEIQKAVEWALDAGYRHVDTAHVYQDEDQVGRGLASKIKDNTVQREDVFITTKLSNENHGKEMVVPALQASLKRLGLDYVELYLIHWPTGFLPDRNISDVDYLDTWLGMEEAKNLGLTKSIGISNFNQSQIERLLANSTVKPAVLQIEVNPNFTNKKLVKFAKDHDIAVTAYSPFSTLVGWKARPDAPGPRIDDPALQSIAEKYNKTTPQVVLRYLVELGVTPLPKSQSKERIEQNIDVFDFKLTSEEVEKIDSFNKNYRVVPNSKYNKHPYYPFHDELDLKQRR